MKVLLTISLFILISACASSGKALMPLKSLENNKMPFGMGSDSIFRAMKKAGQKSGWKILRSKKDKTQFLGKYLKEKELLYIDISIETRSYSIYHRKSKNFDYNVGSGLISAKYYELVSKFTENFNKEIKLEYNK